MNVKRSMSDFFLVLVENNFLKMIYCITSLFCSFVHVKNSFTINDVKNLNSKIQHFCKILIVVFFEDIKYNIFCRLFFRNLSVKNNTSRVFWISRIVIVEQLVLSDAWITSSACKKFVVKFTPRLDVFLLPLSVGNLI